MNEKNVKVNKVCDKPHAQLQNEAFSFCKVMKMDKKPFEQGWSKKGYQWNDPSLQAWLQEGGNYGVMGGHGDLIIFDADALQRLQDLGIIDGLPETFTVKTPGRGGLHFYYTCPGIEKKLALFDPEETELDKKGRLSYKHVADLVAKGMQAVGPGSIRAFPAGELRAYEVVKDVPIASISKEKLLEILKPLRTSFKIDKKKEQKKEEQRELGSQKVMGLQDLESWGKELRVEEILLPAEPIKDNLDSSGELQGVHPIHGSSKEEGGNNFAININKNQWCCYRCGSGGGAWELLAVREGILDCSECVPGWRKSSPEKWITVINKARELGFKIPAVPEGENPTEYRRDLIRYGIEILLGSYNIKTIESEEILIYEDGIYKRGAAPGLKKLIQCLGGRNATNHVLDEVMGACRRYTYYNYAETFDLGSDLIPVGNGLLRWKTGELLPFSPEKAFTFKLPVAYDPLALCQAWEDFVAEITESPEDVLILQEFFGYCMLREYPLAKILLLVGEGRNGKSTLLRILSELLGEQNCSNAYLQDLADKFSLAALVGKMANIAPDIPAKDVLDTSVLKSVSGNDKVPIEQKYLPVYFAVLYAKLIFSANKLPRINDDSLGFWDRIKLLNFPYRYKTNPKPGSGERQADIHLGEKLRAELPGILNWALVGLQRLMEQQGFTENAADKNPKAFYEVYAAPEETIRSFADRLIVKGHDCRVSTGQIWTAFQSYLQALGITKKDFIKRKDLAKTLEREMGLQRRKLLKIKGEAMQGWAGIKLREDWMDILKLMHEARELGREEELESLQEDSPEPEEEDDKFRVCQICSKACKAEKIKLGVCETCRTLGLSSEKLQEEC
jgi:P4 family phage/plasmid primase-like protien